ncbi:integrase catalytic domain-containing protein [Trichonephila clavipes]|nr:integrase catalytic domain-containing protein [Trichonephila clavipes]
MKSAVLNFEELVTLVTQVEECLNSRPLTPLSNDPQDLQPLTPGHFLIGAPMDSFPEEVPSQPACLKKRWNSFQHLRSQFWKRWHLEYLNQLQQRTEWNKPRRDLKVNDLVLVKEDNLPPLQWSLGRVLQVFPGDDGAVRVVDVETQRGQFRRRITKCCLLPSVAYYQRKTELIVKVGDCQVIYSQFGLAIHQNDHQARRRFVEWAQNEIAVVPDFHKRILLSDEAHFWLNGYVNKQNCRIWREANPQVYVETPLHPEKLTV